MKADGRTFFFYRRTGLGSKGAFEPTAPSGGKWVPFEGFEEVERLAGTKPVTTYRFHKEPYYYSPAVEEGQVAPGYGTQTNKDIAQWLDNELPPGKVPGKAANWGDDQNQLSKYRARKLRSPGTEAPPKARTVSGEIGGGSTPTGGAAGAACVLLAAADSLVAVPSCFAHPITARAMTTASGSPWRSAWPMTLFFPCFIFDLADGSPQGRRTPGHTRGARPRQCTSNQRVQNADKGWDKAGRRTHHQAEGKGERPTFDACR